MSTHRLALAAVLAYPSAMVAQNTLNAHTPPTNYAMSNPCVLLFDVEAIASPVAISGLTVASDAATGQTFHFDLLVRQGTSLGGTNTTGPGSSTFGWTNMGEVEGVQGPV